MTNRHPAVFKVTGSWDHLPGKPARRTTTDKAFARRIARDLARKGAWVVVEKRTGYTWRVLYELDGPAQLAAARAAEQAEQQRQAADRRAAEARRARQQAAHDRTRLGTVNARALMNPPGARTEQQRRARHITGGQR